MDEENRRSRFRSFHFRSSDGAISTSRASNNLTVPPVRPICLAPRTPPKSDDDAFCDCYDKRLFSSRCTCGERGKALEWVWDLEKKSSCTHIINENKDVRFHLRFSSGTAVAQGSQPITDNQHFWEVKMTSLVYGTDVMVGIGTPDANLHKFSSKFCSVLGIDSQTWGLSYRGSFHHKGIAKPYASGFGQGSIIGVHLDMWTGTLSFYKNRQPLGIACTGLRGKTLYPMVSSTAARSGMRVIHSTSFPTGLQFLCCAALRKAIPSDRNVLDTLPLPRRMKEFLLNNLGWLLGDDTLDEGNESPELSWNSLQQAAYNRLKKSSSKSSTCSDCNISVMSVLTNSGSDDVERIFNERPSRDVVLIGQPMATFENFNRFQRHSLSTLDDDSESDEEPSSSESKRLKSS